MKRFNCDCFADLRPFVPALLYPMARLGSRLRAKPQELRKFEPQANRNTARSADVGHGRGAPTTGPFSDGKSGSACGREGNAMLRGRLIPLPGWSREFPNRFNSYPQGRGEKG